MLKKFAVFFLAFAISFCFLACDSNKETESKKIKSSSTWKTPFEYANRIYEGELELYEKMAPREVWECWAKDEGIDTDKAIQLFISDIAEEHNNDHMVTFKIINGTELSENELKEFAQKLNKNYNIDINSVTKAMAVEYEMTSSYDKSENGIHNCVSVKVNNEWYIFYNEGYVMFG